MSDLNLPKVPKPDDLRTRMARALIDAGPRLAAETEQQWAESVADVLIRELGLREERDWDAIQRFGEASPFKIINRCRYVTQWRTTDE
jgi:hypothetical protein